MERSWTVRLLLVVTAACGRYQFEPLADAAPPFSIEAYIKASNTGAGDTFGRSVSLSARGDVLAVGAEFENSAAAGIDGDQLDESLMDAGAVYVFERLATGWGQTAYVKASNTGTNAKFGHVVVLSADGTTLAVGAHHERSAATGIDGNQADNSCLRCGAVYVFVRAGTSWGQQAYIKASNTGPEDEFGGNIALSSDGNVLAVVASREDSGATGVDGDQQDDSVMDSGAAYVFQRTNGVWAQDAYIKASNPSIGDRFGNGVQLSGDGETLVVGAFGEDSASVGIDGDQGNDAAPDSGAAYVFSRRSGSWQQDAYLKASNARAGDGFGEFGSIGVSDHGDLVVVSSSGEDGSARGVDGLGDSTSILDSGAAYVFSASASGWTQTAYIKAAEPREGDLFGDRVVVAPDGQRLAISASSDDREADGVTETASDSGAVYVFGRARGSWNQLQRIKATHPGPQDKFAFLAASADGSVLAIGASGEDSAATGIGGDELDDSAPDSGAVYIARTASP